VDLAAIWHASSGILHDQVSVIERAVVAAIERRLDLDGQRAAGREAHKLAGSLGTFGFHDGSRLARALELALAPSDLVNPTQALALSRLVIDLQVEMNRPLAAQTPMAGPFPASPGAPSVLVVDGKSDRARRVVEAAAGQGLGAALTSTLAAARQMVDANPPEVVVVDAAVRDAGDLADFLGEMAARRPSVATMVLVSHAGLDERVEAARMGAQAVLQKPVPPDAVVQAVSRLLARTRGTPTVLALDDDPTFLVLVSEVLGAHGLAVERLNNAEGLWTALETFEPDLLLLDNDMPGVDGISLCRALRGDERWARLPVIFLSGSGSPDMQREMFAAGADDVVSKPVSADDLVTRVVNRIQRSRVQTERPDVDLATGLSSERAFVEDATRLLGLARQGGHPATLVVAEIDPPSAAAMAAVGRLVRLSAAAEDAVGAWPGGRLAALLYGTTATDARMRLDRIVQATRASGGDMFRTSVGLAASPDNGQDLATLGSAAEQAMERAQLAGGNAVEVHAPAGGSRSEVVDVLLVDDDEALGTLVMHALTGRGWSVRWLRDGAEALQLLDGPGFRARAVLLDVGLPELDGLSVLRRLGQRGILRDTRVVMLTVRANEGEVLEALELGAFDHVAKPFSLSVLMLRVRRAVEGMGAP